MPRFLCYLLLCCAPMPVAAQTVTAADSLWFKTTALTSFRTWFAGFEQPRTWLLDPVVVSAWYDTTLRYRQPVPRSPRDSTERARLSAALRAPLVLPDQVACQQWICTLNGARLDPPEWLVAIGEPRIFSDSATVLINRRPLTAIGQHEMSVGRTGAAYTAFFVRTRGQWTMTCLATVATDAVYTHRQAIAGCWTPPRSEPGRSPGTGSDRPQARGS